jgi:dTDP-4-amino-4,6-dideoxygalactose transaminase
MKFFDPVRHDAGVAPDILSAIQRVIHDGHFILGKEGLAFEASLASFCGVRDAVGLNSGTDALALSLLACGASENDQVITTPFTFVATAEVIASLGATPVFVDIDPDTFDIDPKKIGPALTKKTRAIIPVHLYGHPAAMDEILEIARAHHLAVIEDAAQAIGATSKGRMAGAIGDIGCLSFFPTKNLGAYGDAGAVVTNNSELAARIRLLRNHGSTRKYFHEELGVSSRMDELQAAILNAKLPHLETWNKERRRIAKYYSDALVSVSGILSIPAAPTVTIVPVFHQYTIRVDHRNELRQHLEGLGIPTAVHYPAPLHLQPAFRSLGYQQGSFPVAEQASREVLSLPCYPGLTESDQRSVVDGLRSFFE